MPHRQRSSADNNGNGKASSHPRRTVAYALPTPPPLRLHDFPPTMPLGQFLFDYLHRRGVRHCFGIPGDFALPTYAWLDRSPIIPVTATHEPAAGFAADAYARLNGIALCCVTYCVGGLNMLNPIAGAYAEKSPIVVVSGAPGRRDRENDPLVHHKVRTFQTQQKVYDEVTVASAVLLDEQTAAAEIHRCVEACLRHKRPVYIEVPHDMVDRPIPTALPPAAPPPKSDAEALAAALEEATQLLAQARRPVILAGVELHRFGLTTQAIELAERFNIPIAADLLSRAAVPEDHPLYLGIYSKAMSSDRAVRRYLESADVVLMLGTFVNDMNFGPDRSAIDRKHMILATTDSIQVQYHKYERVLFGDFLSGLLAAKLPRRKAPRPRTLAKLRQLTRRELSDPLTMADVLRIVSLHIDDDTCIIADVGDAIFGAAGIRAPRHAPFIAPAYYLSMGFAVPASIGVSLAAPHLRPLVLVGDGAFQMTGTELSTAVRLGLKPIVLILNNSGYGTMRRIREGKFNAITPWHYAQICSLIGGGQPTIAQTKSDLNAALHQARQDNQLHVIEVCLPKDSASPQLETMTREFARARRAKQH